MDVVVRFEFLGRVMQDFGDSICIHLLHFRNSMLKREGEGILGIVLPVVQEFVH